MLEPRASMSAPYTWIEIVLPGPAAVTAWMFSAGGTSA